jgi:PAS domain S-box-containing protein/diguanylate cyclase (GGDEF)-like protein
MLMTQRSAGNAGNSGPIKVLLLEDEPQDADLVLWELGRGGLDVSSRRVETAEGFAQALREFDPDVILGDYSLPHFSGMEALHRARRDKPDTPFIFVSGVLGEERAIEALKQGATDYVLKDQRARLVPAIRRALKDADALRVRRQMELELKESEARLRSVSEVTREWIWEVDPECRQTYSNAAVQKILGYAAEELMGHSALSHLHEDDRDKVQWLLKNTADQAAGWHNVVLRWRHRDGSVRWLESNALPLFDTEGRLTGYRGAHRDVTLRIQQQERIARLSRMHAVLSQINAAIVRIHDQSDLLRAVCRIVVDEGGLSRAWIGLLDPATGRLQRAASAGISPREPDRFWLEGSEGDEAIKEAMRKRQAVVVARATAGGGEPDPQPHSMAVLPLAVGNAAAGVVVIFAPDPEIFDREELGLLQDLAGHVSYALDHIAAGERIKYVSYYDTLTGLANRDLFFDRLTHMIQSTEGADRMLGVLVVDLSRFRSINATLGRSSGDKMLKEFGLRLQRTFNDSWALARISGDRYAIGVSLRPGMQLPLKLPNRLLESLEKPMLIDGSELRPAFKIGLAFYPSDGTHPETLFRNAEAALQRAKDTPETSVFYSPEMNARAAEQLNFESRLREAVDLKQFVVHYQPKVDLKTRRIQGLEALIRWRNWEGELVPPLDFVPLLEETGLIVEVGRWVIEQVARDLRAWRALALEVPRIAVNVSQVQLHQHDFVETVFSALQSLPDSERGIDLELTESFMMQEPASSIEKIRQMREAGIRIFVDDFGTGFSSLSEVARLPFDAIKIDQSFVAHMDKAEDMAVVSTIIGLGHALRVGIVAEGVENEDQAKRLLSLGCEEAQGYLFSRPVPPEAVPGMLLSQ